MSKVLAIGCILVAVGIATNLVVNILNHMTTDWS